MSIYYVRSHSFVSYQMSKDSSKKSTQKENLKWPSMLHSYMTNNFA